MIVSYETPGIFLATEILILPLLRSAITLISKCKPSPHFLKAVAVNYPRGNHHHSPPGRVQKAHCPSPLPQPSRDRSIGGRHIRDQEANPHALVPSGTLTSITNLATSLARNMDRLSLDEEHYNRQEAWRRQLPESLGEGLQQGLSRLGISLLGKRLPGPWAQAKGCCSQHWGWL